MPFSFRLTRLLRLRTQLRRLREHEAAALERRAAVLTDEVEALEALRARAAVDEEAAAREDRLTSEMLRLGHDYAAALGDRERVRRTELAQAERSLTAKREDVVRSHREESKVKRLQEAHWRRVAEELARTQAKGLDELAIDRHTRARRRR